MKKNKKLNKLLLTILLICGFFNWNSYPINALGQEISSNSSNTLNSSNSIEDFNDLKEYKLEDLTFNFLNWKEIRGDNSISLTNEKRKGSYFFMFYDNNKDYNSLNFFEKINILLKERGEFVTGGEGIFKDHSSGKIVSLFSEPALIATSNYEVGGQAGKVGTLIFFFNNKIYIASLMDGGYEREKLVEILDYLGKDMEKVPENIKIDKESKKEIARRNNTSQTLSLTSEDMSFREYSKNGLNLKKLGEFKNMQFYYPSLWSYELNNGIAYFSKEDMYHLSLGGMTLYIDDNDLDVNNYSKEQIRDRLLDLAQQSLASYNLTIGYFGNPIEIEILGNTGGLIVGPYTSDFTEGSVAAISFLSEKRPSFFSFVLPGFNQEEALGFIRAFTSGLEYTHKEGGAIANE